MNAVSLRTSIYVDGFNFYYGALKQRPHCKWANLHALSQRLLRPENSINAIKLFSARVKPRINDPDQPKRQAMYFRAFKTSPNSEIIFGQYTEHIGRMFAAEQLYGPHGNLIKYPLVVKTAEKGSDVNLATHLLTDGFKNKYDVAVVISSDSDLVEPVKYIVSELKLPVVLLFPHEQSKSVELKACCSFHKKITEADLLACQFPPAMYDRQGPIIRPAEWS